jgi:hypothetical protein
MAKKRPKTPAKKPPAKPLVKIPQRPKVTLDAQARDAYREKREKAGARERKKTAEGKDIAPAAEPLHPKLRSQALDDPEFFLREYFPRTFSRPFAKAHQIIIRDCAETMHHGGNEVRALWRGGGKTSLFCGMAQWGIAKGLRRYPVGVSSTDPLARNLLTSVKNELQFNDHLAEDFPDLCFCFRALEDMAARCRGQTYEREKTGVRWESKRICFGYLPDPEGNPYPCSGAVFQVASLLAAARGMFYLGIDGVRMRPDFVLFDDPQTDRSARSIDQCDFRERVIRQALIGLAGGEQNMAGFAAVTPIVPDDLAERFLDRERFPEWQGRRFSLVPSWPTNEALLDKYYDILAVGFRNGDKQGKAATKFYKANKKAIWVGAEVADPHFHTPNEVDALQHALNLRAKDPDGFPAEFLMQPKIEKKQTADLTPADLWHRISGVPRGRVPMATQVVTSFIDVQHTALYWLASGFGPNLGGGPLDYGAWPDQNRVHFTLKEISKTLQNTYKGHSLEAAVRAGLIDLLNTLFTRVWQGEDGTGHQMAFCLIDASEGRLADVVHEVCRLPGMIFSGRVLPAVGKGIDATTGPMAYWKVAPGEKKGDHWVLKRSASRGGSRHVLVDTNFWKSFTADRLRLPMGDRNAIVFPGTKGGENRMLGDHMTAETRVLMTNEKTGAQCEVWRWKPSRPDNHLGDCLVGSVVAGSLMGMTVVPPATYAPSATISPKAAPRNGVKPITI